MVASTPIVKDTPHKLVYMSWYQARCINNNHSFTQKFGKDINNAIILSIAQSLNNLVHNNITSGISNSFLSKRMFRDLIKNDCKHG